MLAGGGGVPEQEGDAPQGGKPHQGKDDPAEGGALAAEEETDQVEPKNADAAPVDAADDGQRQGKFVNEHSQKDLLKLRIPGLA